ncbi:AEC family transporter, partial [Aliarcobacter butzleri]|uniref:AEC family transporter n=1 Tax=Aliarcobacter butzleri TaxID=28197 RepID=UPI003AEF31AA
MIIKLLIAPLIAMIICQIFGWHNTAATVSIMEAAMPTMITAGAIASMAGLAPKISSAIEGNGTMISLFTTGLFYCIA